MPRVCPGKYDYDTKSGGKERGRQMKRKGLLCLTLVLLFLTACNSPSAAYDNPKEDYVAEVVEVPELTATLLESASEEPLYEDEPIPETEVSTFQATDEIQISITAVTDEFLSKYESYVEFAEYDMPFPGIAFIPNVPVRNFRFIEINGATIEFIVERDIYTLDKLLPEKPFVVSWQARGSSPHRGISFTDENNVTRYFVFHYDARGYSPFRFAEFVGGLTQYCYDRWRLCHIEAL